MVDTYWRVSQYLACYSTLSHTCYTCRWSAPRLLRILAFVHLRMMSQPCPPVLTLRHILSSVFCQPINFYWGPWLDMNRSGTLTPECMETAWTFLTFLWMYTTHPSLALHRFTLRFANREIQTLLRPQRNLSGDASEGRGFLPQGGGHLFENLLQAFSPTSKTHSRSRPSYSYQPPSYHQYHPPPSYAPPPQPEPIQEEPVQVVLKGQHALSDSFFSFSRLYLHKKLINHMAMKI